MTRTHVERMTSLILPMICRTGKNAEMISWFQDLNLEISFKKMKGMLLQSCWWLERPPIKDMFDESCECRSTVMMSPRLRTFRQPHNWSIILFAFNEYKETAIKKFRGQSRWSVPISHFRYSIWKLKVNSFEINACNSRDVFKEIDEFSFTGWGGANSPRRDSFSRIYSVSNKEPQNGPHVADECEFSLFGASRERFHSFLSTILVKLTVHLHLNVGSELNWKKVNLFQVKDNWILLKLNSGIFKK